MELFDEDGNFLKDETIFTMIAARILISVLILTFLGVACSSQNITENKEPAQSIEELQARLEDMHAV